MGRKSTVSKSSLTKRKKKKDEILRPKKYFDPARYIDREISWLDFDSRVLEQAKDARIPLLERVRFLSIFHSNLNEFFMKRIGGPRLAELGEGASQTQQQMAVIRDRTTELLDEAAACFEKDLLPKLVLEGIHFMRWKELKPSEKEDMTRIFHEQIFPVLTPLAVDPGHPFPHISNLSLSLAVSLKSPERNELLFSRLKVPEILPSWFCVNPGAQDEPMRWIPTLEIIEHHLGDLFHNMEVVGSMAFRVTRNIELDRDEAEAEDLLEMIEEELHRRRFGEVVKVEVGKKPDAWLLEFLISEMGIAETDIYYNKSDYALLGLGPIIDINKPELKFRKWTPVTPKELAEDSGSIFNTLTHEDILVHHPYESFNASVERFVQEASDDPNVLAIKLTLYRTSEDSKLIRSLMRAAGRGKQVVVLVELKARLDEERNIAWANKLEEAGVHIVYGIVGLKTHSKTTLVVRRESSGIKCYAHVGTGNYHTHTAKMYTDFGLLTSDPRITKDLVEFFHYLTGRSLKTDYNTLLVAPVNMKRKFIELIEEETKNAKAGRPAHIMVKCNNLEDHDVCEKLYEASAAGVRVDLLVRSICVIRPQVKGLSDNIYVSSVVDRFLEHSRVYAFARGATKRSDYAVYLGSADWMYRNLQRRVEVAAPLLSKQLKIKCMDALEAMFEDPVQRWTLGADGIYSRTIKPGEVSGQEALMLKAKKRM